MGNDGHGISNLRVLCVGVAVVGRGSFGSAKVLGRARLLPSRMDVIWFVCVSALREMMAAE